MRLVRGPAGLEGEARAHLHARLRLLAARRRGEGVRRLRRERGAPVRGTFLIDKSGVVVWSLERLRRAARSSSRGSWRPRRLEPRSQRGATRAGPRSSACTESPVMVDTSSSSPTAWRTGSTSSPSTSWSRRLMGAAVESRAARRRRARVRSPGPGVLARPLLRRPCRLRGRSGRLERVERLVLLDPAVRSRPTWASPQPRTPA